ncbi:hypothetical protein Bca4012_103625 [Brassica carinata]
MTNCANQRFLSHSGRADIEGSKSNAAMNAWLPQASYPCDVPPQPNSPPDNVLRSIDPPKRVLDLKEGVVTPPRFTDRTRVKLNRVFFPADSAKPAPLAVVSLDSRQGHRIPLSAFSSELAVRRQETPERAVPSPSPPTRDAPPRRVSSSSSPPTVDGFELGSSSPALRANPFPGYGSILPTSLAYIVPSTRGCSPWRPDAVMSTTGDRLTHVQVPLTWNLSSSPSKFSFEYLLLPPRSAPTAAPPARALGFAATAAPSYSSRPGSAPTAADFDFHDHRPAVLIDQHPLWVLVSLRPPPEFLWLRPPGIVHHLSVPTGMLTLEPFSEDQGRSSPRSVIQDGSNGEPTGRRPEHADAVARREARAADHD